MAKTAREPSLELESLSPHWPEVERQINQKRRYLSRPIREDDPIRFRLDMLSPIARILDENVHTRALAYLFDEHNPHGFGRALLVAFIEKCPNCSQKSKILKLLRRNLKIYVLPEYRFRVLDFTKLRSVARCDIKIEIRTTRGVVAAIVIIENKIGNSEGHGQLWWYEKHAKQHAPAELLLVYLTREGDKPTRKSWVRFSYLELASALRDVWSRKKQAAGRPWLGLYIAAITRGVLGIDVGSATLDQIKTYLGERPRA